MSVRENIASNLLSTISGISSPITIKKATRQPFELEELSQQNTDMSFFKNMTRRRQHPC